MKYIYCIIAIVLLLSVVMWQLSVTDSGKLPDQNALLINERVIPFVELQQRWQEQPYHYQEQKEFIEDQVVRELLLQEAVSAGIADEEQFKRLVKDYFEQSLVKTLLDRKLLEQKIPLSPEDISRFRAAQQLRYRLTLIRYQTYQLALDDSEGQPQPLTGDFVDLPAAVTVRLLHLTRAVLSTPFADSDGFFRVRIEQIERSAQNSQTAASDEELQHQLGYLLQQQKLAEWLQQVRQQAVIRYPQQQLEKGDN